MAASALSLLATTVGLLLLCCLLGFLGYTVYLVYVRRKYAHIPGPPLDSFYLGNVTTLIKLHKKNEFFGPTFTAWAEEYGGVFKVFTAHIPMLVFTSPAMVKEVMTKGKYPKYKRAYSVLHSTFGERFCGTGLVTNLNHAAWYKRRNTIQPAFHKKTLSQMMDKFNRVGNIWIEKLDSEVDEGKTICMFDYYNRAALASLVTVGFGLDIDAVNDPDHPFTTALHGCMNAAAEVSLNPTLPWDPSMRKYRRNSIAQAKLIRSYSRECIDNRFQEISKGNKVSNDILTKIINTAAKLDGITTRDLQDEFNTLFMAGLETSAANLSFITQFVGQRPDVLEKMRQEVDEVLGDKTEITWDDVTKLEYVDWVIKEALRLVPVAWATCRYVEEETEIDGVRIPAGSPVMVDIFSIHHLNKHFEDPWEFKPERWSPEAKKPALYTYIPFAMGPRSCAGRHFATIESKVLIAKFLQNFTYDLDPNQEIKIDFRLTLRPQDGCKVNLQRRDKNVNWNL